MPQKYVKEKFPKLHKVYSGRISIKFKKIIWWGSIKALKSKWESPKNLRNVRSERVKKNSQKLCSEKSPIAPKSIGRVPRAAKENSNLIP